MRNYESVSCIVCDSTHLAKITNKGQFGFETNVCVCKECGLSFLNPRWDKETYLNFYKDEYDSYYRPIKSKVPPKQNPSSYYPILKRLENSGINKDSIKTILDIGSGDGSQMSAFIDEGIGIEYHAIEPSEQYRNEIMKRGINFISNDIDKDWDSDFLAHFDFVIMRHVLEHFSRPDEVLQKICRVLKPDGVLYLAVPDSLNPRPALTKSFFRVVHTYYFNKFSLSNIFYKSGLEIISMSEGDEFHDELFSFAKRSNKQRDIVVSKENFKVQYEVFFQGVQKEHKVIFKFRQFLLQGFRSIVKLKKYFFPNPVKKRRDIYSL
ncbi:MAG: class I SAM-dependent methyltransferase [Cyclobacteriaceae bacterium]